MLSLNTHNILDYVGGAILVLCPFVFGFSDVTSAKSVFLVLGFGLIAYSLITNYRYSMAKIIPVPVHMGMDLFAGLVLMAAPYIFGYRALITGGQTALHFVLGLGVWGLVAMTRRNTIAVTQLAGVRGTGDRSRQDIDRNAA